MTNYANRKVASLPTNDVSISHYIKRFKKKKLYGFRNISLYSIVLCHFIYLRKFWNMITDISLIIKLFILSRFVILFNYKTRSINFFGEKCTRFILCLLYLLTYFNHFALYFHWNFQWLVNLRYIKKTN